MARWKRDLICGIVLLIVCLAGYLESRSLPKGTAKIFAARADVYVWCWLTILAVLSVLLIIGAVRGRDTSPAAPVWSKEGVFTVCLLVCYLLLMEPLGFLLSTFLFLSFSILVYSWRMGKLKLDKIAAVRRIFFYLVVSAATTAAVKELFTAVLKVRLPNGMFF